MDRERQVSRYLECLRCGSPMSRVDGSSDFYSCDGNGTHPPYLVSPSFDTEKGDINLPPMTKRRVPLVERIKRKLRAYLV